MTQVPDPRRRRGRQHPLPFLLGAASGLNAYLAHYPAFAYNGQVAWIRRAILGLIRLALTVLAHWAPLLMET